MNYYGTLQVAEGVEVPEEFGHFLKRALGAVPSEAPYRGPAHFEEGRLSYTCGWEGSLAFFSGEETIRLDGKSIYRLYFHGGAIR